MGTVAVFEWVGSVCGVVGALLMALSVHRAVQAYALWLLSSVALVAFGLIAHAYGVALMNAVFTGINLLGLRNNARLR